MTLWSMPLSAAQLSRCLVSRYILSRYIREGAHSAKARGAVAWEEAGRLLARDKKVLVKFWEGCTCTGM